MRILTESFQTMLDVFACTDGGGGLATFHANYDDLVRKADEGDVSAVELIVIFDRAAQLVKLLSQQPNRDVEEL